jgi:NAD(P)-dependent dehydrogenase (short-subunit alcohol dehydrogenase family)
MTALAAAEFGIAVNAVAPGLTSSDAVKASEAYMGMQDAAVQRRAFKRQQLPEDLIGPVVIFISNESGFVTGQTLLVDGGSTMQ